jgi:hypothetical protein
MSEASFQWVVKAESSHRIGLGGGIITYFTSILFRILYWFGSVTNNFRSGSNFPVCYGSVSDLPGHFGSGSESRSDKSFGSGRIRIHNTAPKPRKLHVTTLSSDHSFEWTFSHLNRNVDNLHLKLFNLLEVKTENTWIFLAYEKIFRIRKGSGSEKK